MNESTAALMGLLADGRWGLARARDTAGRVARSKTAVGMLVATLFDDDGEMRARAADVARRITERSAETLWPHAEEMAGLLAEVPVEEARTRWHLGLVVARVAHTREQRMRAARLMKLLATEESAVVRCSAVEGMALLACQESTLWHVAEEMVERALREGSKAERCRAREARRRMDRRAQERVE